MLISPFKKQIMLVCVFLVFHTLCSCSDGKSVSVVLERRRRATQTV